jgi:hypothetical protein
MTATIDWAGDVETAPLSTATNLGAPIAVTPGGEGC